MELMCFVAWTALATFPVVICVMIPCSEVAESLERQPEWGDWWLGRRFWRTLTTVGWLTPREEAILQVDWPLLARAIMFSFWAEEIECMENCKALSGLSVLKRLQLKWLVRYNLYSNHLSITYLSNFDRSADSSDNQLQNWFNDILYWTVYISIDTDHYSVPASVCTPNRISQTAVTHLTLLKFRVSRMFVSYVSLSNHNFLYF